MAWPVIEWSLLLDADTSFPINNTLKPCNSFFCNPLNIAHPHKPKNLIAREALRKQHEQLLRLSSASYENRKQTRLFPPSHLKRKNPAEAGFSFIWRRARDSNPGYPCGYNGFRIRPVRPLRQLSRSARMIAASLRPIKR